MTWTPEQAAQRREWGLEAIDSAPDALSIVDPMDDYLRTRPVNGQVSLELMPEPPDEVELPGQRIEAVPLSAISTDPPPPMLIDRLDPEGHTILYGTGGVGKGALACWWVVQLVRARHRILIVDYEAHPAEWSRRIAALDREVHGSDAIWHMAPTDTLTGSVSDIAIECEQRTIDVVVVDSAVMACGADPLKPEVARNYQAAVIGIGRPTLSLAHVTKADDMRYPFGSVFWHNLARTTWGMQQDQSGTVVLSHRKHNNYAALGRFAVRAEWDDGRLLEVWEQPFRAAIKNLIRDALASGPRTITEVVDALSDEEFDGVPVKRNSVTQALVRGVKDGLFTVVGERYALA